ncbi:STAS domain-containing protein [Streptomyces sp. SID486]|uniref:STAS domain-containing protein n=1 Tax=unclassified Streptomyces TaxID=2593676 RepID=UPI00136B656C|nr:STAS domain-containing protein [Streptomyces sp. SID486]MYX98106.1 STAS domain-containing protein [Streptomyces sp. SID486]
MLDPVHRAQPLVTPGLRPGTRTGARRPLPPGLAIASYTPGGSRTRVEIRGELDLDSGNRLRTGLLEALADSATGLDLDLSGLTFCDCAGLGVLLDLRQRASSQNKSVLVRAGSPLVDRLLHLIGVRGLSAPHPPPYAALRHPAPDTAQCPKTATPPAVMSSAANSPSEPGTRASSVGR